LGESGRMNLSLPKILFVDDEVDILSALKRSLRKEPYQILLANGGKEGLDILRNNTISVVVADERMPGMSGYEFLEVVKGNYPDCVRIILTGYADNYSTIQAINKGEVYRYLSKPWEEEELKITIINALERNQLTVQNRQLHRLTIKQNRQLLANNKQLKCTLEQALHLMSGLLEMRSSVMGAHSMRVGQLARELANRIGLTSDEVDEIAIAASLHDIGKSILTDEILQIEHEKLTASQFQIYQQHTEVGEKLLLRVESFKNIATMVRQHHEHCDGSGFPDNLTINNLLLGSRIIALANSYDNILNSKNQEKRTTPKNALLIIAKHVPNWFETEIFAHLQDLINDQISTYKNGVETEISKNNSIPANLNTNEIGLHGLELQPGMVLSRKLYARAGVLLFPKGAVLSPDSIKKIKSYGGVDSLLGQVFIKRSSLR